MQTYITVSCEKQTKIERGHGVYVCYVCGALTNTTEIIFEKVSQHNPYNNPRGPVNIDFDRELEEHPVCPSRFATWHLRLEKILRVIFKKKKLGPVDKKVLARVATLIKKNRAETWRITEKDDLTWEWMEPSNKPDHFVWSEVLKTLHNR